MSAEWEGADPPGDKAHGRLTARDPVSGDIAWEKRYEIIPHSGLLSTAGGLVFIATYDGWIEGLDAQTGDLVWRFNLGSGTNGGIVSFEAGGDQYIAVATGHGSYVGRALATAYHKDDLINYQESALVVAFKLP
jgi:alcohol dehydrogenase (cytochrome c)